MSHKGFLRAACAALAAMFLSDCPLTPEGDGEAGIPGGTIEECSELFEEPEGQPGTFVFLTNDRDLWGPYGCTLWALTGTQQQPFAVRELELTKLSGNSSAGFGLVLCHYRDEDLGETMLVVLINTKGQFIIGEAIGAEFQTIVPWTHSPALLTGYNANRLRVQRDGESFRVFLNGQPAATFRDENAPLHSGGADGLIVVISPLDRFPETPVHVVFKEF